MASTHGPGNAVPTSRTLSQEVCGRIVQFIDQRRAADLATLCTVSRAFNREAEPRLYHTLLFSEPRRCHAACHAIISSDRQLASHVRTFYFVHDTPGARQPHPPALPPVFWTYIQKALAKMRNLDVLMLYDQQFRNTWVFENPADFPFQLRELRIKFLWDDKVIRFVRAQKKLEHLYVPLDTRDQEPDEVVEPLPGLVTYEGSLAAGKEMIQGPSLRNFQVYVGRDGVETFLGLKLSQAMRGLNVLEVPEDDSTACLEAISRQCPGLRHLGQFKAPVLNRHDFLFYLTRFKYLKVLELDLSAWAPSPLFAGQRSIAAEAKMYCPSLRFVFIWIRDHRIRWVYTQNDTWTYRVDNNQWRLGSNSWFHTP